MTKWLMLMAYYLDKDLNPVTFDPLMSIIDADFTRKPEKSRNPALLVYYAPNEQMEPPFPYFTLKL